MFGKTGKKVNFLKNLRRGLTFERCSTRLLARQRDLRKANQEMPECKFVQLTGSSTSLVGLVVPEFAAGGARISCLQIVISYMQLFYMTCLTC